jgi:hypothetical protein
MQRRIVGSAWEIQASKIVASGRIGAVECQESPSLGVESSSFHRVVRGGRVLGVVTWSASFRVSIEPNWSNSSVMSSEAQSEREAALAAVDCPGRSVIQFEVLGDGQYMRPQPIKRFGQ